MLKKYFLLMTIATPLLLAVPSVSAVDVFNQNVCERGNAQNSTVCEDKSLPDDGNGNVQNPIFGPQGVLTKIINILTIVVSIAAIIVIILAGLKYITSGTNPQDVTNARERIIYAVIALVVAAMAQIIVRFVVGSF